MGILNFDVLSIENSSNQDVDILFIIPPFHMRNGGGSFFPLGLGYIISQIEMAGITWQVINCTEYITSFYAKDLNKLSEILKKKLMNVNPSIIGIGPCVTTQLRVLKLISEICKEVFPEIPVFAGGPLASIDEQEWVFYDELSIKYIIKGDGELAVVDAIKTVKNGLELSASKFISYEGYSYINFIEDIDSLPFPYRNINEKNQFSVRRTNHLKKQAAMITSRGCPYACNYCVSGNLKHNNFKYRKRSTKNILDEMQLLYQKFNVNDIVFYDDCFFHNPKSVNSDVSDFCKAFKYRNMQMTWQIEMRPDVFCALSDDSIKKLFDAGCHQISLGIEKISNAGLKFLGKQNCWGNLETQIKHVKSISSISISATFILGGIGETVDDIKLLIGKTTTLQLDFAHFNPLFVYPGTPIYDTLYQDKKEWVNHIFKDDLPWGEIVYETPNLTRNQLLELIDYAYSEFYKTTQFNKQKMIVDRFNIKGGNSQ